MKTLRITPKKKYTIHSVSLTLRLVTMIYFGLFIFSAISWSQSDEWTVYNTFNSGIPYNGVIELAIDAQGDIWIGTGKWNALEGGGLAKFDGESWTVYNVVNSGLPNNDHSGLAIDPQGNIWSGTESGLTKFDGDNWTIYNTGNSGLKANLVASPSFDTQGNLWIGSWGGGLAKFDGTNWMIYTTSNSGLANNRPWDTIFDAEGNLWIGTNGGGLVKYDGSNWTVYNQSNSGLPNNVVGPLCFDSDGTLWIGSWGGGVVKFNQQNWTVYHTNNSGLPNNNINDIKIDARGNIWIGTAGGGLAMFNGQNWTVCNTSNSGLPGNTIYCLTIDAQGSVWIGTEKGGLAVYRVGERLPVVDFNGDGTVDIKDLIRLIESWGQDDPQVDIAPPPFGDGIVDASDLELLMSYWEQPVDDPTLLAHWALDETEGIIAYDSAGVNDAVVVGGTTWQPSGGKVGGALLLNGVDGCAITNQVMNPADGPFSVFAWIKSGEPGQVVISQQKVSNWLGIDPDLGSLITELMPPAVGRFTPQPLKSECVITDGQWHHIGFVWDGVNRSLYVDDILIAEDTQDGLQDSDGGLYIGTSKAMETGTYFSGLIDDVRIYNRAVSP